MRIGLRKISEQFFRIEIDIFAEQPHVVGAAQDSAQRDVFDRTIRPSIREAKSSQSRPQFPIAARIDAFKRRLIESRRWSDRNDVVQPDVIEWMYSLGWRPPEQEEESLPVVPLAGNAKETSP